MTGRVISTKLKNTATILVERLAKHPLYKKTYLQSKKYLVEDQIGVKIGDIVDFIKCKPISKNKHWKITKVSGRSMAEIAKAELKEEAESIISEVMPEEEKGEGESGKSEELEIAQSKNSEETKVSRKKIRKESK